jgi:hypothetical protein
MVLPFICYALSHLDLGTAQQQRVQREMEGTRRQRGTLGWGMESHSNRRTGQTRINTCSQFRLYLLFDGCLISGFVEPQQESTEIDRNETVTHFFVRNCSIPDMGSFGQLLLPSLCFFI